MQELDQMTPKLSRPGRSLLVALGFGRSGAAIGFDRQHDGFGVSMR
jgi:hypothetical protein